MHNQQTAQDIFARNDHHNLFRIKLPSHNATQQNINNLCCGYMLNKLALIPFQSHALLPQLYKTSLEHLVQQTIVSGKHSEFVLELTDHLQNWHMRMKQLGTWPYTRAAFYSIQDRIKDNPELLEKVVLKRALLEPNKQEFMNRAQNLNLTSQILKKIRNICDNSDMQQEQPQLIKYQLPRDILFCDTNECWLQLQKQSTKIQISKIVDYLRQYEKNNLLRYVVTSLSTKGIQQTLNDLRLRKKIYESLTGNLSTQFLKIIELVELKHKNNIQILNQQQ